MIDPRAAMIILRVLVRKFGLQIDMTELEGQAKEIETALKQGADKDSESAGSSEYIG
jgi:proteasome assembly chaperone (PAC2) family protein